MWLTYNAVLPELQVENMEIERGQGQGRVWLDFMNALPRIDLDHTCSLSCLLNVGSFFLCQILHHVGKVMTFRWPFRLGVSARRPSCSDIDRNIPTAVKGVSVDPEINTRLNRQGCYFWWTMENDGVNRYRQILVSLTGIVSPGRLYETYKGAWSGVLIVLLLQLIQSESCEKCHRIFVNVDLDIFQQVSLSHLADPGIKVHTAQEYSQT